MTRTTHRPRMVDRAALDMARDYGAMEYRAQILEQQLERARHPHWTQSLWWSVVCWIIFLAAGVAIAPRAYAWWYGWEDDTSAPAPTAMTIPTRLPTPTSEPAAQQGSNDPPAEQPPMQQDAAPQSVVAPAWSDTKGGPALQAEPEQDLTNNSEKEAQIDAWLNAPVSTPTPTRSVVEIVSDAAFDASFIDPGCSPFIGYLPGDPCVEILKQQAGE